MQKNRLDNSFYLSYTNIHRYNKDSHILYKGYLSTYQAGIAGIWSAIGFISFIGFALLILGYKEHKKSLF